ncbi:formyltransferase family protein [bacterium]|nr:formyltransferase family protein [bacterium]
MRIVVCSSKSWFKLNPSVGDTHVVNYLQSKDDLSIEALDQFKPDLVFFPHWNWIVSNEIFEKYTCIVFHTAPLPFGRGGSPIQNLIKYGYTKSPVCALAMSEGIDAGPIYDQIDISLNGSLSEILGRLNDVVNELILRLIDHLPEPKIQTGNAHLFKRLGVEDNEINYESNIEDFYDSIRMLDDPSYPNAYLNLEYVCIEFSDINRKGNELFCKVRILEKDKGK